jgi:RNA polymerase sigma-70 factor (ECF subfamily)
MDSTPVSLLERMRKPGDEEAWARFIQLATPLLNSWAHRIGLQAEDASDLTQEVLVVLVEQLPEFSYDREKSFRAWMRTIALNKWRKWRRRATPASLEAGDCPPEELAVEDASQAFWEQEYRNQLLARAMQVMQADFQTATWQACYEHIVSGRSAAEIAAERGLTVAAVYAAKVRVLKRLREELQEMME